MNVRSLAVRPSFLSGGLIYALANVSAAAVPFLLLPILTRVLSADEYGRTVNFLALVTLCGSISGLSLHGAIGVRWFERHKLEFSSFAATCLLVVVASTVFSAVAATVLYRALGIDLDLSAGWVASAAVVAGANTLLNARLVLWRSQRLPLLAASMQVGYSVLAMALSILGVVWLQLHSEGRMGGAVAASLIAAAVAVWSLIANGEVRAAPSKANLVAALRFGVPLVPHALAGVAMSTSHRLVVGAMLGPAAVGKYGAAAQLGMAMTILGDAFAKSYGPWMYDRLSRSQGRDKYAVVGASWLSIPAFLLAGVILGSALQVVGGAVLGKGFRSELSLIWWFVLGGAFNGMYLSVAGFFFFSSRTEYVSIATVSSALAGAALCYFLVGALGFAGGGLAYAATQVLAFVIALTLAMRMTRQLPWKEPWKAMAIAIEELRR